MIALHSPKGVVETGLFICPPEIMAAKLANFRSRSPVGQSLIGDITSNFRGSILSSARTRRFSTKAQILFLEFLRPVLDQGEAERTLHRRLHQKQTLAVRADLELAACDGL